MKWFLGAATILLLAGCLNTEPSRVTLDFDLNVVGENWTPKVANVPLDRLADVGVVGEWRDLPAALNTTRKGVYLAGTNVTGDMFLFTQRRFTGLAPNTTFTASFAVQFATDIHADCTTGIGPSTFIKAGATLLELTSLADNQGILRVSENVGVHTSGGDFTLLGDIRNGVAGCPTPGTFGSRTTITQTQPLTFTTDIDGGFILFVGLDSSFMGRVELYLIAVRMILT